MKSLQASLSLAVVLSLISPASAAEPPALERQFIEGMRTRGYSRLALEYLQDLEKHPPADLAAILPLEIARTQISLAQESPLDQRPGLYAAAMARLTKFEKDQASRPDVVQAKLEIARLVSLQGKVHLSKAVRAFGSDRQKEAKQAREQYFTPARTRLADAIKLLDAQMLKLKGSKNDADIATLATLDQEKLQAEFDLGINVLLQAETYYFSNNDDERGKLARQAYELLNEVSKHGDAKNPLIYKALTWLIPALLTSDDPKAAIKAYKEINVLKADEYNLDAKLLADYFHLGLIPRDDNINKNLTLNYIKKEARDWLKSKNLALFGNTPGGYGIRIRIRENTDCYLPSTPADVQRAVSFEWAEALVSEAMALKQTNPKSPHIKELYREAQKLLTPLQDTESDLARKAEDLNLAVFVALRGKKTDINELTTFKELYFQSRYEAQAYYQAKEDADRQLHLHNMALALRRALDKADSRVPASDLLKASVELTDVYLHTGDLYRAVVLGEHLARTHPTDQETSRAAAYALEAYVKILRADRELSEKYTGVGELTPEVMQGIIQTDQDNFNHLAEFVETQPAWRTEPVAQYARYQRALLALQNNDYLRAIPLLNGVQSSWDGYHIARCQLALALVRLTEDDPPVKVTEEQKKQFEQEAFQVLTSLPELPVGANLFTFHFHYVARLKQCKLLYRKKQYQELEKFADQLLARFDQAVAAAKSGAQLNEKTRADLRLGLETWKNYARVGLADKLYRDGKYDEVLAITDPIVARVRKQIQDRETIKDFQMVRDMLELGLRAEVQKKRRKEARAILEMLQRIASDSNLNGGFSGIKPTEILVRLVLQLRAQVQDLRQKGPAAAAELKQTIDSFTDFMDELTTDLDKLTRQLDDMSRDSEKKSLKQLVLGLLARSYANLGKHKQAAQLLARITEPKAPNGKALSADVLHDYLEIRLLYVQELCLNKEFATATKALAKVRGQLKDNKSLSLIILAQQADMAEAQILEGQGKFKEALTIWNKLIGNQSRLRGLLADRNFESLLDKYNQKDKDPAVQMALRNRMAGVLAKMYKDVQKMYFDCWYHRAYCMYKYGDLKKDERWIKAAANVIWKMKNAPRADGEDEPEGWKFTKGQFEELLRNEKSLRDMVDKLKATPQSQ